MNNKLYVITPISNQCRYQSRYRHFRNFEKHVASTHGQADVEQITVECAFSDRPFEVTSPERPGDIQLRTNHELWHKENLINLGFSRLPQDWQYAAWIDADVFFERPDWALETIQQLKHYSVVQMFSHAIDLGPSYELVQTHKGFGYGYLHRKEDPSFHCKWNKEYDYWHTGFAWAIRREAFDKLWNGLIDFAVLGAADHHMAWGLVNMVRQSVPAGVGKRYLDCLLHWQSHAEKHIRRNIGYVPGVIRHHWHGKKKDRRYVDRWKIITQNQFDPDLDLKRDWQGVLQLTNRNIQLRDDIRKYFRSRNEDSIDLE